MEIRVQVSEEEVEHIPDRVRSALDELAASLAEAATPADNAEGEVVGFQFGVARMKGMAGGFAPIVTEFCVSYSEKDGGSCGVFSDSEKPRPDDCTAFWT